MNLILCNLNLHTLVTLRLIFACFGEFSDVYCITDKVSLDLYMSDAGV